MLVSTVRFFRTAAVHDSSALLSPSIHDRLLQSPGSFSSGSSGKASMAATTTSPSILPIFLPLIVFCSAASTLTVQPHRATFIVRVDPDTKPSIFPTHTHWYSSSLASLSPSSPTAAPGTDDRLIHTYASAFHGFSAKLSHPEAGDLRRAPGVLAVIPEQIRHVQTTRSPHFMGLEKTADSAGLLKESDFGSDLVIAVIDTGIWPERRSFDDRGLGPAPAKWKGRCVAGKDFPASSCNNKVMGARFFSGGYEATNGRMNESLESRSPRDRDGHGTHTASIAAGRYVSPASALGNARGIAAGMAPKARLAVYKVCWVGGCYDSDIIAAFDAAVADGVDVISLSVGGVVMPYYLDAIAIAAFGAFEAGIFVSASAGNGGPGELTVTNVAPWVTTVGAGTLDRDFPVDVRLGNGMILSGSSVYDGGGEVSPDEQYPLIYAGGDGSNGYSSSLCLEDSLNPAVVGGKIVLCDRGTNSRTAKGAVVKKAGGIGMILANGAPDGEGLVADSHVLPATAVGASAGDRIREYISKTETPPTAAIVFKGTQLGVRPAPVVASFSARGPNPETPEILKPDIIAPGVNILSAWPDGVAPSGLSSDARRTEFNILSGTSMACPHVSGVAALLKAAHPEWSPAAIRSALMTTAYTHDNRNGSMVDESTGNASAAADHGAGHVDPQKAMDPGLVFDLTAGDFVSFLCNSNYTPGNIEAITKAKAVGCGGARRAGHSANLNYPSLSAVFRQWGGGRRRMRTHLIRTVTNVGEGAAEYVARVEAPGGTAVSVEPGRLSFRRAGQRLSFVVRVEVEAEELGPGGSTVRSGAVVWTDGAHVVRSPVVVTLQQPL